MFLYAFDLIELNGDDLRRDPLVVRKATLTSVLAKARVGIRYNEHLEFDDGEAVFNHACRMGLEGIVSKRQDPAYRSGRSPDWLKMKNPACEAVAGAGGLGTMRDNPGAQYEISVDGVPRTHRDRQDIALQTARFLKSQNPNSVVKMKDLRTGEETIVAFKPGE